METFGAIIVWTLFGLICGALARLIIPGRQPLGILMTILLGVIGSFVGGFLAFLISGGEPLQASGFFLSLLGAIIVLAAYVAFAKKRHESHTS